MVGKQFNKVFSIDVLSFLVSSSVLMIDVVFANKFYGSEAAAACSFSMPAITVAFAISTMAATGTQVCCGRLLSRHKKTVACEFFNVSLCSFFVFSLAMTLICVLLTPFISNLLGAEAGTDAFDYTNEILIGISLGFPASTILQICVPMLQIDGDKKRVLIVASALVVANFLFIFLSINVYHGGLFGIGFSTSLSFYVACFFALIHFLKKNVSIKIDFVKYLKGIFIKLKDIVKAGFPYIIANISNAIMIFYLNNFLLAISGLDGVSTFGILTPVMVFSFCFGTSLGTTTLLMSNIFNTQKNLYMLKDLLKTFLIRSIIINAFVMAVLLFFNYDIAKFFVGPQDSIFNDVCLAIIFFSISLIPYAINICFRNLMQGTGNLFMSQIVCVVQNLISPIVASLISYCLFGYENFWVFFILYEIITLCIVLCIAWVKSKGKVFDWQTYLFLNKKKYSECVNVRYKVKDMSSAKNASVNAYDFCLRYVDKEEALKFSLMVEEVASTYFSKLNNRFNSAMEVCILKTSKNLLMRVFNNGPKYNPKNNESRDNYSVIIINNLFGLYNYSYTLSWNINSVKIPLSKSK